MKMAFVIVAYKDPSQIERLIKKFSRSENDFYIHLDKKINISNFSYLEQLGQVYFVKGRVKVNWGGFGVTAGIFNSLDEILKKEKNYDFISIVSGQDYLIKPIKSYYSYLENNLGKNFIFFEDPGDEWWSHAITRINQYHMTNYGFRGRYRLQFFINRILPKRKFPLPYKMYGGPCATFMTITSPCAKYLVDFIAANKKVKRFSEFAWGTDEFLIPTIIMNSDFKNTVVNDNLYYIDWSKGGSSPKVFTSEDFDALKKSDKFLARKFDIKVDTQIMDLLDTINQ
ncbi:MAG: glycosyltransferase [Bacteroidetes bacterium]|nr:glycosyltransferase [Bacteroidota bacterium]